MTLARRFSALSRDNPISTLTINDPGFDQRYQRTFSNRRGGNGSDSVKLLKASFKSAIFGVNGHAGRTSRGQPVSRQISHEKMAKADFFKGSEKFFDHVDKNIRNEFLLDSSIGRRTQSQSLVGSRSQTPLMDSVRRRKGKGDVFEKRGLESERVSGKSLNRILTPKEFTVIKGRESESRREGRKLEAKVSQKMGLSGSEGVVGGK